MFTPRAQRLAPWFLAVVATAMTVMPARAQDPAALWQQIAQPAFDPAKVAVVENVTLTRDRIRITLVRGAIQFSQPAAPANIVFGAAFRGHGRVEVQPPNQLEAQQ